MEFHSPKPMSDTISAKGQDGKVRQIVVGICPLRSITTKAAGVIAARCTYPGAVGEASLFETCWDIALHKEECSRLD